MEHRDRQRNSRRLAGRARLHRAHQLALLILCSALLVPVLGLISGPVHRGGSAAAESTEHAPPAQALLTIRSLAPVRVVPRSFFGLSTEYWTLPIYERHVKLLERILSLLHVRGEGPMVLRIGGDSADHTRWDPHGRWLAPWVFRLTPSWLASAANLVRQMRLHVILDMNLVTGSARSAAEWARVASSKLPHGSIVGFEIGNEPDIYDRALWVAILAQLHPTAGVLPADLTASDYRRDFVSYARRLSRVARGVPLIGPVIANPAIDVNWIATLLAHLPPGLRVISAHRYPFSACAPPRASAYPTIVRILGASATTGLARTVRGGVALAHRAGVPFRLTELNSVTCGGLPGVSNTFATALWAPDALFELLRAGVDGVNMHVREYAINAPFTLGAAGLRARPLIYGLILFVRTLGPGGRLLQVHLHLRPAMPLKAWAVRLRGGVIHLLIIDKAARGARVALHLPGKGAASVQRLLAPGVRSTSGVILAGQHLAADGSWQGAQSVERLSPRPNGYELTMPGFSAALVSVHPGRR